MPLDLIDLQLKSIYGFEKRSPIGTMFEPCPCSEEDDEYE